MKGRMKDHMKGHMKDCCMLLRAAKLRRLLLSSSMLYLRMVTRCLAQIDFYSEFLGVCKRMML